MSAVKTYIAAFRKEAWDKYVIADRRSEPYSREHRGRTQGVVCIDFDRYMALSSTCDGVQSALECIWDVICEISARHQGPMHG